MKTIVITGSTRGIGYGLASAFLERGCQVVLSGRTPASVERALNTLQEAHYSHQALGITCDVTEPQQVQDLWDRACAKFNKIDIWINNAGFISSVNTIEGTEPAEIKAMVETNLLGSAYGARVALIQMLNQGFGAIYNMEGLGSDGRRQAGMTYYGVTKRGLSYFTDCLADEVKGTPIIAAGLSPGMVMTDLIYDQYRDKPDEIERVRKIFNILADRVENVAPWLADKILSNQKSGIRISYLTRGKILGRFLSAPFSKRDVFQT
jgi:NAD(P)-dependent dehydrogenase (short-subunit alcohol dehydrogenase family)